MSTTQQFRSLLVLIVVTVCTLAWLPAVIAMPANPNPIDLQQPDGTPITLRVRGDEFYHWFEDLNGYAVVAWKGRYVYAKLAADGNLQPTAHAVGKVKPVAAGLIPGLRPTPAACEANRAALRTPVAAAGRDVRVPPSGTVKNLVVLCRFSDHIPNTHTRPEADYDTLFNAPDPHPALAPTGSVRAYYTANSYGTMTLDSTVTAWVALPEPEAYYADGSSGDGNYPTNPQGMVEDALNAVDAIIDFGNFDMDNDGYVDAITIIHSGYGAETGGGGGNWIWSHKWSLDVLPNGHWTSNDTNASGEVVKVLDYHTNPALFPACDGGGHDDQACLSDADCPSGTCRDTICRIGVVCHETGHFFRLPDLYDIDENSNGIGSFGLMGNSWGFDGTQLNPPHLSAWSKDFLEWVEPESISVPGIYTVPEAASTPTVYRIDQGYPPGEYLLIENRQPVGFETVMPQGGLAIWHIDETKAENTEEGFPWQPGWPANNKHYKVALLQADGNYDLERLVNRGDGGDLYHAGGVFAIDETTVPSTDAYQGGNIIVTQNEISSISAAGSSMTFIFGPFTDCNSNGVDDSVDLLSGTSQDCQSDGVPDECQLGTNDCNHNGLPDDCDTMGSIETDSNGNGVPDSCEGGLKIEGDFQQGAPGTLWIELRGIRAGESDRLTVTGTATLGGELTFEVADGFNAPAGAAFVVLSASSIVGNFTATNGPSHFDMVTSDTTVALISTRLAGDADLDDDVDLGDYAAIHDCLTGPSEIATPECRPTDNDGDRDVDLNDFALLQAAFTGQP